MQDTESLINPLGIALTNQDDLIISEYKSNRVQVVRKEDDDLFHNVTTLKVDLTAPGPVLFDRASSLIYVSDPSNILIARLDGSLVSSKSSFESENTIITFESLDGLCINEMTGELYVVDYNILRIFK